MFRQQLTTQYYLVKKEEMEGGTKKTTHWWFFCFMSSRPQSSDWQLSSLSRSIHMQSPTKLRPHLYRWDSARGQQLPQAKCRGICSTSLIVPAGYEAHQRKTAAEGGCRRHQHIYMHLLLAASWWEKPFFCLAWWCLPSKMKGPEKKRFWVWIYMLIMLLAELQSRSGIKLNSTSNFFSLPSRIDSNTISLTHILKELISWIKSS